MPNEWRELKWKEQDFIYDFGVYTSNKNKFGIYKIELNDKIYVGSTVKPFKDRWAGHLTAFRKGRNSPHMQNAYNKYGEATLRFFYS